MESLKATLSNWDGRETVQLQEIYNTHHKNPEFIQTLTDWSINDLAMQNASTWLLKRYLDQKNSFTRAQTLNFLPALAVAKEWPAQLHLLQMLPYLPLAEEDLEILLEPIEQLMQSKVKFVKAWAYYAFGLLTELLLELKDEVAHVFQIGLQNESAAIKVRIRKACEDFDIPVV